ncbi:hypothetical protein FO519_007867 [Halicephalobus sp. NKZ332]|nr:hypothetical protein FO519_007867 [Halicephalobus sp. NKZ332]
MQTVWTTAFFLIISFVICLKALPFSMQILHLNPIMDLIEPTPTTEQPPQKFGTLKLCPPGGRSFFEAFQLACPMRRKRSAPSQYEYDDSDFPFPNAKSQNEQYRPATIDEIMKICCVRGCEFTDFFPHCGPFGAWNETGRFVPDKWFDQMFAVEVSKNSLAGRKKNLSRMEDELGLSPQRRQFTGGCVPGSNNKNQGSGKWRNGKTASGSEGQRQDNQSNRWRSRNDDNGERNDRYKNRHNTESLPEWADSNISINDIVELKGFDGTPPVTSKIPPKETSRGYSEAELLEELKRKGPSIPAQKESTGGSRFIHLFNKRSAEGQKPAAPQTSKDPLHGLSNLFSQPQENLPSMPYSGVMATDFESRMNIADEEKLLPELTSAIRSPPTVHTKDVSFPKPPMHSENTKWTEEAILAGILGKSDSGKGERAPSGGNKETWNGVSNAPISSELYGMPRNESLEPERRRQLASPSVIHPGMQPPQLQTERSETMTPPMLPPAFDHVLRNYVPNDGSRPSQRSDSPSSTSSRRSVPPPFSNFPQFPNGPIPPPSMFIPGLNGMPMLNPFAFAGMNFPPGMMPPPMGGAPPPPNVNRSGVNLPTSVLLRRRNNEANASPDVDQQQRPPMRTEMTNFDSNLHDDDIRQNSPLPDDPSEVRSGSRNANFGNPQNERPPNMMPNMFPFEMMMCNMFSMAQGGGPMPPMGVPDGRGFPPMFRMPPPPGMSLPGNIPPGVFPMQGPMCPPSTSNINNPNNEDRPWNRSPVRGPETKPPQLADPAPTDQSQEPCKRIPESIIRSIPTTAKMMTVEDLERALLSKN